MDVPEWFFPGLLRGNRPDLVNVLLRKAVFAELLGIRFLGIRTGFRKNALELLHPRTQFDLPRPGTAVLAVDLQIGFSNGIGRQ